MNIILNGKTYVTNKNIGFSINFTGKKVYDEIRGYLVFFSGNWIFIGTAQLQQFATLDIKKLALVLESPHKDEFDKNNNPLRPANGKTGYKINNKIALRSKITGKLNTAYAYEVYLMNSIQYQTSCYCVLGSNYSRDNTNQVFRILFAKRNGNGFDLRAEFITRLKNYNPDTIINCCTSSGSLKKTVKTAIKEAGYSCVDDIHPSVW